MCHVDIPIPNSDEVVIKVELAGVCGTDLKLYKGDYKSYTTPVILGHEFCGIIVEMGEDITNFHKGNKVVAETIVESCRSCENCLNNNKNLCNFKKRIGFDYNGSFAEYIKVKENQLHLLHSNVQSKDAVLAEPLAVVVHALNKTAVNPGDVVLIIGPGTIGLLSVMLCNLKQANIVVSGLKSDEGRLNTAKKLGA